ncbi:hypothetical protein HN415_02925 [Candidatus Woesearchaeota archaeon]|nr:hypothetical protein [Candidatus Woesearchaeota archaeon]
MVSSIAPQFEAISVHHHGVNIWNKTEPIITAKNIIPACMLFNFNNYLNYKKQ